MFATSQLRNIGILAHIDAGKTTLTERVLFYSGVIPLMGEVHDGTTVTDWMSQEQERGITITAASISCRWRDTHINLIDTPGHVDFTVEVERSLRVLDGAVAVLSAVDGVQSQTEAVWRQAQHHRLPVLAFVNKMDREGADVHQVVSDIETRLGVKPVLFQLPLVVDEEFVGVIDILSREVVRFDSSTKGVRTTTESVPEHILDEVEIAREMLLDAVLVEGDPLVDAYLLHGDLPRETVIEAARRVVHAGKIVPVFCGAVLKNIGVQPLLDAVVDLLPAPTEITPETSIWGSAALALKADVEGPLAALVFKRMNDLRVGSVTYIRLFSGQLKVGDTVLNPRTGQHVVIGRLVRMLANEPVELKSVGAGDIAAVVGLEAQATGDTLCSIEHPLQLEAMTFPQSVAFVALEPATAEDSAPLEKAVRSLVEEDPTLQLSIDPHTGQLLVRGVGELQLEVLSERLRIDYRLHCRSSKPRVAYLETVSQSAEASACFSREVDAVLQEAEISIRLSAATRGDGLQLLWAKEHQDLPKDFLRAMEEGFRQGLKSAGDQGYDIVDVLIQVTDIQRKNDSETELAFRLSAREAVVKALSQIKTICLEPQMRVEIVTPDDYMGPVVGDLSARRGNITQVLAKAKHQVVTALVPLSTMFGYATDLRSLTQGRASFTMQFYRYERITSSEDSPA